MERTINKFGGKKFSIEAQVKSDLFGHFFRDANDWINIYKASQNLEIINMSIMTKQFILLRMDIECILKAILIGLSNNNESAKQAYKSARKCSHNLEKLIEGCKMRINRRYHLCKKKTIDRIRKIDRLSINVRYDLDMKTAFKNESFAEWATGTGPVSGVVIDEKFQEEMEKDYYGFVSLAMRVCRQRLKGHNIRRGSEMAKVDDYIKRILT